MIRPEMIWRSPLNSLDTMFERISENGTLPVEPTWSRALFEVISSMGERRVMVTMVYIESEVFLSIAVPTGRWGQRLLNHLDSMTNECRPENDVARLWWKSHRVTGISLRRGGSSVSRKWFPAHKYSQEMPLRSARYGHLLGTRVTYASRWSLAVHAQRWHFHCNLWPRSRVDRNT